MKVALKISLAASLAAAGMAMAATPAAAQVNGIATSSPEAVIFQSQARLNAYEQITQTYSAQVQQVTSLRNEIRTLSQGLDTNNDGQLSQAEADAQPGVVQQIEQKQRQAEQTSLPIALAQNYVIEQLLERYGQAQTQVIQTKNIQIMLTPEAFQYAAEGANVTPDILAALNALVPAVTTTPPANYQPRPQVIQLHQTIQQLAIANAQRAAAAAQQQGAQQPAQQQPSGR